MSTIQAFFFIGIYFFYFISNNNCRLLTTIQVFDIMLLTQAGYWFTLRFCDHFTCLSSKIQNAIKLENISNLITSPSSYQCMRRKTRLVHFLFMADTYLKRHTRYYSITLYLAQVQYTINLAVPCVSRCEITMTTECKQTKHWHIAYYHIVEK
jgi:hypothetical protein